MENLSAKQIAQKIRDRKVSSREATDYFIAQIEKVNPTINAVVVKRYQQARAEADEADRKLAAGKSIGRLHGLPITIKECLDLVGTPSTLGIMRRKDDFPGTNDPYIEKLRNEGAIILGKTNVPQMCSFYEAENPVYGVTNNPYDLKRAPGGSSGGEGSIIAAGGSPLGIGTDIGGSLRSPAAFCGIASIKPTMWRTPDYTRFIDPLPEMAINSVAGPMSRHVEDLEMMLDLMNESEMAVRKEVPALGKSAEVDLGRLRVGYFLSDGIFEPMPAIKRAVLESVEKLKENGASLVEWAPPNPQKAEELFFKILSANGAELFTGLLGNEKAMPQITNLLRLSKMSPFVKSMATTLAGLAGQSTMKRIIPSIGGSGADFHTQLKTDVEQYRRDFAEAMDKAGIDAILGPPCALPAYLHRTADKVGLGGTYMMIHNLLGYPAGIVPISTIKQEEAVPRKAGLDMAARTAAKIESNSAGLPLTVQIAARPWQEHIVLAVMASLQRGQ